VIAGRRELVRLQVPEVVQGGESPVAGRSADTPAAGKASRQNGSRNGGGRDTASSRRRRVVNSLRQLAG
jgi:hypothetical protein